jgi:hypothetical protein
MTRFLKWAPAASEKVGSGFEIVVFLRGQKIIDCSGVRRVFRIDKKSRVPRR